MGEEVGGGTVREGDRVGEIIGILLGSGDSSVVRAPDS